jgi:hypothetical protein
MTKTFRRARRRVGAAAFVGGAVIASMVLGPTPAPVASAERSLRAGGGDSGESALPYGLSGDPRDYGPRRDLPEREASGSLEVTNAGTVVENLTITGSLTVAADDVTIRNVAFRAPSGWKWPQRRIFLNVREGSTGTVIEDSTFDGSNHAGVPVVYDAVAGFGHITLRRSEITKVANAIEWGSGTVEHCFIHEIWQSGPKSRWHADGIQSNEASGITVRSNYIRMGRPPAGYWSQTSAVGMWSDRRSGSVLEDVRVTRNVIEPFGGFVFYAGITNGVAGASVSDVVFADNVVRRAGVQPSDYGVWYQRPDNPIHAVRTGNVYDDGAAIPPDA